MEMSAEVPGEFRADITNIFIIVRVETQGILIQAQNLCETDVVSKQYPLITYTYHPISIYTIRCHSNDIIVPRLFLTKQRPEHQPEH